MTTGAPLSVSAAAPQTFSVVIPNRDYAAYLGAAIDSALTADWPDVEVIVVDDGSVDGSRELLKGYADRVRVILQENAGQRAACNRGYAASRGDVVIFLDSDDMLHADAPARIAAAWTPATVKVQGPMVPVDARGATTGEPFPRLSPPPAPATIRAWFERTSAYPTPPGSGNAYARAMLEHLMPIDEAGDDALDSSLLASAPLWGDVVSVELPLAYYRVHGANDSDLRGRADRFDREIERAVRRWTWAQRRRWPDRPVDLAPLRRSREVTQFRVAARAVGSRRRPLSGLLLVDVLRSPLQTGPEARRRRLLVLGWCLATMAAPRPLARLLVRRRYRR